MFHFLRQVIDWYGGHLSGSGGLPDLLWDTVRIAIEAVLISIIIAFPFVLPLAHLHRGGFLAINISNIGRAMPALAVLVIAVQIWGIGTTPALITLVALTLPPIATNSYVGIRQVDPQIVDAARGMGMTGSQILRKVELPSALPMIAAGIRTASVQAIAIVPLTAFVSYTSLGTVIQEGIYGGSHVELMAGSLALVALALLTELALAGVQRMITPRGVQAAFRPAGSDS